MTGRENIYLNGTIIGMKKHEIKKKFDTIVDFADIGDFIDSPVSTYSSGMYIRLGFAIAVNSAPNILLADEVLAVGDLPFALKSYRAISQFRQNGGSILLVSHGLQLIRNSCQRVYWLRTGWSIRRGGSTRFAMHMKRRSCETTQADLPPSTKRWGQEQIQIRRRR